MLMNNMMAFNFEILFQMIMSMTDYMALMRFFMCNVSLNK